MKKPMISMHELHTIMNPNQAALEEYRVIIEETISQEFKVQASDPDEAREIAEEKYHSGEFCLDNADKTNQCMCIIEPDDMESEWFDF